jgi:hypothetical protein
MVVRVTSIEQEQEYMNKRLECVEAKVYNPSTVVAVLGLVGTIVTAAGSIIAVVLIAVAKTHGWM